MDADRGWTEYYDAVAAGSAWGEEADHAWQQLYGLWQRPDTSDTSDTSVDSLLDLGCGDGRNTVPWLRLNVPVVAVDSAPSALKMLVERCSAQALSRPSVIAADMRRVPLTGGQLGAVQCFNAVFQVREVEDVLSEMTRLVRVGGWLAFNLLTPGDVAYGEGVEVAHATFEFQGTTFRFFGADEAERIIPRDLQIVEVVHKQWWDPPHVPFRPYRHRHDGLYFFCRRVR